MAIVYEKSRGLTDVEFHYCPGCHHGIIHKLVAESLVELGLLDDAIGVCPVGCSVFAYKYFNCDMQEAAHGRAPAVATGIKRTHPHQAVFTYQGDGTWPPSARRRSSTPPCGARSSRPSLSTMPFTA